MMVLVHQESMNVLVGQKFACVLGDDPTLEVDDVADWPWKSGIIRAASHKDVSCDELKVIGCL